MQPCGWAGVLEAGPGRAQRVVPGPWRASIHGLLPSRPPGGSHLTARSSTHGPLRVGFTLARCPPRCLPDRALGRLLRRGPGEPLVLGRLRGLARFCQSGWAQPACSLPPGPAACPLPFRIPALLALPDPPHLFLPGSLGRPLLPSTGKRPSSPSAGVGGSGGGSLTLSSWPQVFHASGSQGH